MLYYVPVILGLVFTFDVSNGGFRDGYVSVNCGEPGKAVTGLTLAFSGPV